MAAILVGGEKGGTGKSTVAINLAVEFAKTGQQVLLVDCDKQQTAAKGNRLLSPQAFVDLRSRRLSLILSAAMMW
jgi:MinD superfamily P-loop ATPase